MVRINIKMAVTNKPHDNLPEFRPPTFILKKDPHVNCCSKNPLFVPLYYYCKRLKLDHRVKPLHSASSGFHFDSS